MRYLILISVLIGSVTASAASMHKNSLESIAKRLDRLDPQIKQLDLLPSLDAKKRSQDISLRLRRLENRVAILQAEDSTKHPLNVRIQEMRKKLRDNDPIGEKKISTPTGNGVIRGRLRDAVTGKPIGPIQVEVDIYDSEGDFVSYGYVDEVGRYEVRRLSEGTYYATTYGVQEDSDYIDQLYENISCYDSRCNVVNGKPIQVTYAHVTPGINFNLVHGAHVTGHVVDAKTLAPISSEEVDIYDSTGTWGLYSYADTDESGFFDTGGYDTGQWYASTFVAYETPHIDELYSNITCWALQCNILSGTPIQVTTGETTSNIDFSLDEGGRFRGQITDADNNFPTGQIAVDLFDSTGQWITSFRSDAEGYYEIPGLVTGNYFAVAGDEFDCYHDELYNDISCDNEDCNITDGTPIAVTTGQMTSGIDFALAPYDYIAGRVIDSEKSAPLIGVQLWLYDLKGDPKRVSSTESNGVYHICPKDPGTYFLRTMNWYFHNFMDELYADISCFDKPCIPSDGTPIVVNEGSVTSGIDLSLEPCLYCLDFHDWADQWNFLKPSWTVFEGDLIGSSSVQKALAIVNPTVAGCSMCSVSATMKTEGGAGSALYLLGWYENNRNTIELVMKQETGKWVLRQHLNGAIAATANANFEIQSNVFYNAEITYNGTDLNLKIDGSSVLTLKPVGNLFGTVGFKVKNTIGHFGAVVVKQNN